MLDKVQNVNQVYYNVPQSELFTAAVLSFSTSNAESGKWMN